MTITFLTNGPNLPTDLKKGLSIATESAVNVRVPKTSIRRWEVFWKRKIKSAIQTNIIYKI
jgi:hypothetical protein